MNDDVNVQFPECPRCGAPPGQAHDPTCESLCLKPIGDLFCMKPTGHDGDHDHRWLCLTLIGDLSCMKPAGHTGDHDQRAWPWADKPAVTITEVAYTVTALAIEDINTPDWTIKVERTTPDRWAVRFHGRCWNFTTGDWNYEPLPSSREDDWLAACRTDLDTALAQASVLAPTVTVNGLTAAGYLEWKERHAPSDH